jgi:hypothetical protein
VFNLAESFKNLSLVEPLDKNHLDMVQINGLEKFIFTWKFMDVGQIQVYQNYSPRGRLEPQIGIKCIFIGKRPK